MGASHEPPYLYDGPAHRKVAYPYSHHAPTYSQSTFVSASDINPTESTFNPKAVTQASYARLSQQSIPKPKQQGPLIDFNKHPDSYVVFGGGVRPDYKALPPGTKKGVVGTRWAQFALRLLQEIMALGLLAGTICIKGTKGAETYLLRIPQAWDSLITLYAIYHLLRPAKGRTPGSSASYHTFALIMDIALIPLYVYVALALNSNRQLPLPAYGAAGNLLDGNWRFTSFFEPENGTYLLLFVCFIGAAVIAGLHLLSCGLDLYLVLVFRRIAVLPPDMNPLEDNLTGGDRSKRSKHKYKNSELTVLDEKETKHMSASTLSVNTATNRGSVYSADGARELPFGDSRHGGSKTSLAFSPHNPESARLSRAEQEAYTAAASSPRTSRYEVRPDGKLEVRTRRGSRSPTKSSRSSVYVDAVNSASHGDLSQMRSEKDLPCIPADEIGRALSPDLPHAAVQMGDVQREQGTKLLNDNWYVLDAEDEDDDLSRQGTPGPPISRFSARAGGGSPRYAPVQIHDRHDSFESQSQSHHQRTHSSPRADRHDNTLYGYAPEMMPKPLGMHPPTPPIDASALAEAEAAAEAERYRRAEYGEGVDRAPTTASHASQGTAASSVYSESSPSLKGASVATPKGKYYGNLAAATRGVRGSTPVQGQSSPIRGGQGYGAYGYGLPPSPQPSRTPSPEKHARVVSRTGADIADESVLYLHPRENNSKYSMRSRREVSGKIAEEGRGGGERGSWARRG